MQLAGPETLTILSGPDILLIVVVFLLLFGGKKIPDLAKGMGQGIRNFKEGLKNDEEAKQKEEENKEVK